MNSLASQLKKSCKDCSIRELCIPIGLSDGELEKLDEVIKKRRPVDKDNYIFRNGEAFKSIYAVRSGAVKTYILTEDGAEQITGFHFAGELVGLEGISEEEHKCNAVAIETTSLCEIPFEYLDRYMGALPALRTKLLKLLSQEISSEQAHLLLIGQRNSEEKLATFLIDLSNRLSARGKSESSITLAMAKSDIANYLSLANETVSRTLNKFQSSGLISVHGKNVEIIDRDGLCSLSALVPQKP